MLRIASLFFVLLAAGGIVNAQTLDGRLRKIADTKSIAIAYRSDATPFSYTDDRQQPIGYTIDICKRVVASLENQLGVQGLQVKWVPVTSQNRFDAVASGQADMECGASTVTLSRMKVVDFSNYTFIESTGLLTTQKSGLRSLADLAGKRIGVVSGTTNERAVNELDRRRALKMTVVPLQTREEAIAALEDGRVDAYASDKLLLLGAGLKAKHPRSLVILPDDLSIEPYAIALPRGDAGMRLAVNTGLAQIYRDGEIGPIFGKWFGALGEPAALQQAVFIFGALSE
ncbi:amino acid ABC transporter substrate-binding protein [Accumulibacter sp.]|uniref:amino acid ABC transporter substrate-binding protein n=1 Tax=Accumulibacter sp. TaxID=2053492 RepID=UPI0025DDA3FC|nr:amino acid ABC transporter substrate-binding protein [Accumulibacter sp.]MCM8593819.1 amino acid ABC transporter substrate-binding protein [Accumulibacter sp.]MCM8626139.1 amino acid ABC transporter substrate-binding protein [Accumulibacter sp.]MDS4047960.1 amino acid ABC transporter substrate-binding protein [Accumulibacter sp.]